MAVEVILKHALRILLCYCTAVVAWQLAGLTLLANGYRALGPSASLAVAAVTVVIALALVLSHQRLRAIFYALCAFVCWGAASTILNAFTADPSLWPSGLARYVGVAINLAGFVGAAFGLGGMMFSAVRRIRS